MKPYIDPKELAAIEAQFYKDMPDYTQYTNGQDLLDQLGSEGMKWAAAFCQITKKKLDIQVPLMYAMFWFSNAIEHGGKVHSESEREEPKLEDIKVNNSYFGDTSEFDKQRENLNNGSLRIRDGIDVS